MKKGEYWNRRRRRRRKRRKKERKKGHENDDVNGGGGAVDFVRVPQSAALDIRSLGLHLITPTALCTVYCTQSS